MTTNLAKAEEIAIFLQRAVEFHGHLGPFLVLGLKMGFAGLRELNVNRGRNKLQVTAKLNYSIPFSCAVDGLQIATKCTMGNKKLKLKNHSGIAAEFELEGGKKVTVTVKTALLDMLQRELTSKKIPSKEVRDLAHLVASIPEEKLFIISRG